MWTLYLEILFFLQFVTPTVIPDNRKLAERENVKNKRKEEKPYLSRKKRDALIDALLEEEEEEDVGGSRWEVAVCRTEEGYSRFSSRVDQHGRRVLVLGSLASTSRDYQHYVKTHRCVQPDQKLMVGGEHVKCVQQYIEETLVVFDVDSGEKFYERSIFLPSGCAAMRETRKH